MVSKGVRQIIISMPRPFKMVIALIIDLIVCALSVWLSFGLRLNDWGLVDLAQAIVLVIAVSFSIPIFIFFGLYRTIFRFFGPEAFVSMAPIFIFYTIPIFFIFTVIGVNDIPRSIGILQPILFFIGVICARYVIVFAIQKIERASTANVFHPSLALIYGAGFAGRELAQALAMSKEIAIKGFIDSNPNLQGGVVNGVRVYREDELEKIISRLGINEVLLAIPSASRQRRNEIISNLSGFSIRVRTVPSLSETIRIGSNISDIHDLDMGDLLGRDVINHDELNSGENINNRIVLITGAGGSIGSELCRQVIKFSPAKLILLDSSEHSLYEIHEELKSEVSRKKIISSNNQKNLKIIGETLTELIPCLGSAQDRRSMDKLFSQHRPFTVFHAAAYKHVPLVEQNPTEGIRNNVLSTLVCAQASLKYGVKNFTLVSTDKAVRPTNIMGASKRVAELIVQAMAQEAAKQPGNTFFSMVRFGNVLGSSGSVAPLFSSQIKKGGPITLTHLDVTRYFMTIPEAAELVIQSSAMSRGGEVFVLDMGAPIRIYDLARKMVYLSGHTIKDEDNPAGDIEIVVTGLRPGEKLYEELLIGGNPEPTRHPKIMKAHEDFLPLNVLLEEVSKLNEVLEKGEEFSIKVALRKLVPGYKFSEKL